jgi:hypothetical protein
VAGLVRLEGRDPLHARRALGRALSYRDSGDRRCKAGGANEVLLLVLPDSDQTHVAGSELEHAGIATITRSADELGI